MSALLLAGHGISVTLPQRWEGRLYLRETAPVAGAHVAAYGHPGENANPVLHLANFALPPGRGDFGSGAVETMNDTHVFLSLVEYDADEAGRPLFGARGFPRLTVRDFGANQLQRKIAGQLGAQRFFTAQGRPFCLYAVLGSQRHAVSLIQEVHEVIAGLRVGGDRWARL
ncbi:MAG: hypothetical protein ACRDVG_04910 [Jatrophihabitantaceae bacterium]